MTHVHSNAVRPLSGTNYCTDKELVNEIIEAVSDNVGDVRYGSGVVDHIRHQFTVRLEDGRRLRMTFMFE